MVNRLKSSEVQFITDYYQVKFKNKKSKRLQLFKLILNNKVANNEQAAREIYKFKPDSTFCHLKRALEEDLLNFMMLTPMDADSDDGAGLEIKCRKTFLQSKILISRGIYEEGIHLLKKTAKLAERYEYPDLKLAAYDILREYQNHRPGLKSSKYYTDNMEKAFNVFRKILNAKSIKHFKRDSDEVNPDTLTKMRDRYDPTESKRAYFWYEISLIEKQFKDQNYQAAKDLALELLGYIDSETVLDSSTNKAVIYIRLATAYLHLGEYQNAVVPARRALQLYTEDTPDYLLALRVLFFAYYRKNDLASAADILDQAFNNKTFKSIPQEMWLLLQAALRFSTGEHLEVRKSLNEARHWKSQKPLWHIGLRLLELLNILELQDYDWFEFKLDSFRKKLSMVEPQSCTRLPGIYTLLKSLVDTNYRYQETYRMQQNNLSQIQKTHWDPMGYELINVPDWLACKVKPING